MGDITKDKLIQDLVSYGRKRLELPPPEGFGFETGNPEAEKMLKDIVKYPHHFVLGCVMDRQMSSRKSWLIPYKVGERVGGFSFGSFLRPTREDVLKIFEELKLHRFPKRMADCFYLAIQRIKKEYDGDASKIWRGNPKSAAVIRKFLEFKGVGPKIATMAANILLRDFKIPMRELSAIDISPDTNALKCFTHYGILRKDAGVNELIYLAREIYPDYPGILDIGAFEKGRELGRMPATIADVGKVTKRSKRSIQER